MRLILFDLETDKRRNFYPISLSRPVWELRSGITSLGEKLINKVSANDQAFFVPSYMAEAYRSQTSDPVNAPQMLRGKELLLLNGRIKPQAVDVIRQAGPNTGARDPDGDWLYLWLQEPSALLPDPASIDIWLDEAASNISIQTIDLPAWHYTWELVLANSDQLIADFATAGRRGVEGTIEQSSLIRGSEKDVYVAPSTRVHPMVVINAEHGPVYLDEQVEVHPFTQIEGPCYVGRQSILLGTRCRRGNSIGPLCKLGGELEQSIIQGYSNKYHDGFLGHAYVGQWVNIGAGTSNSDLRNDYSTVKVVLDGHQPIDTDSTKFGCLIGDHTKTSIGTLFNTGAYVGAMSMILATGRPLTKYIPDFTRLINGLVSEGPSQSRVYETARNVMARRGAKWSDADQSLWDSVYELTSPQRDDAIGRGKTSI